MTYAAAALGINLASFELLPVDGRAPTVATDALTLIDVPCAPCEPVAPVAPCMP